MSLKQDLNAYLETWEAVENIQVNERRSASLELRWMQLNAAYGMAKVLGLLTSDSSEMGVFERWAKLKEKAVDHPVNI